MLRFLAVAIMLTACHPRLSVGYDGQAHTTGPLANLQTIPRIAAVTGIAIAAPAPPEGRNYNMGLGFGDKNFTINVGLRANNISKSTLDIVNGPQYVSAAAALEFRYNWLRWKNFALSMQLAPTRTFLLDSTSGNYTWGSGVRYGAGMNVAAKFLSVYADAYQERIFFFDGPAAGMSTRTGISLGVAVQMQ
jgi:hypothetical protein